MNRLHITVSLPAAFLSLAVPALAQGTVGELVIPGAGHTHGGAYGEHKRYNFFARHLLGVTPPAWTAIEDATNKGTTTQAEAR